MNTSTLTFQSNPNQDELTQAFEWWEFFNEESLGYILWLPISSEILVAKVRWKIVWAIMYRILSDWKELKIDFVEVAPDFRWKWVGIQMIAQVEDICSGGFTRVTGSLDNVENSNSIKMFEYAGFLYDGKYNFSKRC